VERYEAAGSTHEVVPRTTIEVVGHTMCCTLSGNLVRFRAVTNREPLVRFGQEVRRRRELRGMSLEVLAHASGLTPNYIGSIETGRRDPSLSSVLLLARGLDVMAGELLGDTPSLSPVAEEVARLYDRLVPGLEDSILQILRLATKRSRG
jgi:transcriptional regulator with XRE-family HTH domain